MKWTLLKVKYVKFSPKIKIRCGILLWISCKKHSNLWIVAKSGPFLGNHQKIMFFHILCDGWISFKFLTKKLPFIIFLFKRWWVYDYFYELASKALHFVIFENFVKSMTSCLSELKVTASFCIAFKIPDNVTATNMHYNYLMNILQYWN